MRQLYVCSHVLHHTPSNTDRRRLIGVLREITPGTSPERQGRYEFQYLIGGKFHEDCLKLYKLYDPNKIYDHDEIYHITKHWLPEPDNNDMWLKDLLKAANLTKYDEWKWLKHFGQDDYQHFAFLYETLPEEIIRYE